MTHAVSESLPLTSDERIFLVREMGRPDECRAEHEPHHFGRQDDILGFTTQARTAFRSGDNRCAIEALAWALHLAQDACFPDSTDSRHDDFEAAAVGHAVRSAVRREKPARPLRTYGAVAEKVRDLGQGQEVDAATRLAARITWDIALAVLDASPRPGGHEGAVRRVERQVLAWLMALSGIAGSGAGLLARLALGLPKVGSVLLGVAAAIGSALYLASLSPHKELQLERDWFATSSRAARPFETHEDDIEDDEEEIPF